MTAPNMFAAPDGAFTIGGGSGWKYGQNVSETHAESLFSLPVPTPDNMTDSLQQTLSVMPQAALDAFAPWLGLTEAFNGVEDAVNQIMASFSTKPLTQVIEDVMNTIDGLVRGLVGWIETGYTAADVEAAAKDVTRSISDMRTIITSLLASNGYAGNAVVIDFSAMPDAANLGSSWTEVYWSGSGSYTFGIQGGRAVCIGSSDHRWFSARYNVTETKSDYQKIGIICATKPSMNIIGGAKSNIRILGRLSSDQSTFVAVDFTANGFTLGCSVSGAWTTWYTRTSTLFDQWAFKPGAVYWLECGTSGGARIYRVWENSTILTTYVESSATSQLGAGYRSAGISGMAFSDDQKPAQVAAFSFYDNQSAPKRGSGWRIARTSTSTANLSSGDNTFPSAWFDTPDYITDDLIYDSTNNKITVAATGWYNVTVKEHGDAALLGNFSVQPTLIVNGAVNMRGQNFVWVNYNFGFSHSFIVYLNEGDEVKPGYWSSASGTSQLTGGEAAGRNTYWSGVFLGTNKKLPTSS